MLVRYSITTVSDYFENHSNEASVAHTWTEPRIPITTLSEHGGVEIHPLDIATFVLIVPVTFCTLVAGLFEASVFALNRRQDGRKSCNFDTVIVIYPRRPSGHISMRTFGVSWQFL